MSNRIFIGENYAVMQSEKFLEYKGKVRMIYIDPPYNTQNTSFAYSDINDQWVEDIKKRLQLARSFLTEEGVIFISIDDNEIANLLQIGYEIFGKENYVGMFITKQAQRSNAKYINTIHEYVVSFAKNKKILPKFYIRRMENPNEAPALKKIMAAVKDSYGLFPEEAKRELKKQIENYMQDTGTTWIRNYCSIDEDGEIYFAKDLSMPGKPNRLDIDEIDLHLEPLKTRSWASKEKILELYAQKRIVYKNGRPYAKEYLYEAVDNVSSIIDFYSRQGTEELKKLELGGLFETAKPVELIKFLIRCSQHQDAIIMDFYGGSGTTAQAVYEINREDKKNHNYILIQLVEKINEKSRSYEFMQNLGYEHPKVSDAMMIRINTYLKTVNMQDNYEVVM